MKFFTKEVKIALTAIVGIVVLFYGYCGAVLWITIPERT